MTNRRTTQSFIHPSIHSFMHSFIHPFIHPFIHSFIEFFLDYKYPAYVGASLLQGNRSSRGHSPGISAKPFGAFRGEGFSLLLSHTLGCSVGPRGLVELPWVLLSLVLVGPRFFFRPSPNTTRGSPREGHAPPELGLGGHSAV